MPNKPLIRLADPLSELNARRPAHAAELVGAHEFAWRAVGLAEIMHDFTLEADDVADKLGELEDGDVFAGADIDVLVAGIGLEQEYQCIGAVVGMEKFAARGAGAPDGDALVTAELGLVGLADEGRHDVAGGQVEIVAGAIEIGRHG